MPEINPDSGVYGVFIGATPTRAPWEPRYTDAARHARIQGNVILDTVIDTAGRVQDVTVLRGQPLGLTENAVEAVRQWRFEPSILNGRAVAVRYVLTVRFRLE